MKTRKSVLAASFGILATLVVTAAVSWACSATGYVGVSPGAAPAGSVVTVSGGGYGVGENVPIRWNGSTGPVLYTATGPNFSVKVTIPANASPDVYYIVAGSASASFTVTTGSPMTSTPTESGPSSAESGSTAGSSSGSTSRGGTSAGAGGTEGAGGTYSVAPAAETSPGSTSGSASDDSVSPSGGTSSAADAGTVSSDPVPSGLAEPSAGAVTVPGSAPARFSPATNGSGASPGLTASGKPISVVDPDGRGVAERPIPASAMPSSRTVSGDVWGGFATGLTRSNLEPSLGVGGEGGDDKGQAVALSLLGLGGLGMLAGLALTTMRPRRQVANARHVPPAP